MIVEVVGFAVLSYVNRQGRQIDGIRIYGLQDRRTVMGKATVEAFVSGRDIKPPEIGSVVRLLFNQNGRCLGFISAE